MNRLSKVCLIFTSLAASALSIGLWHPLTIQPELFLLLIGSVLFVSFYTVQRCTERIGLLIMLAAGISVALPLVLQGKVVGWDIWIWLGDAKTLIEYGQLHSSLMRPEVPGLPLLTTALHSLAGVGMIEIAKYTQLFFKFVLLLCMFVTFRSLVTWQLAALGSLLFASYFKYMTHVTYHYFSVGIILYILFVYLVIRMMRTSRVDERNRYAAVLSTLTASLLIYHAFSTFYVVILSGIAVIAERRQVSDLFSALTNTSRGSEQAAYGSIFLAVGLLGVSYQLWVSSQYFETHFIPLVLGLLSDSFITGALTSLPAALPPEVVQQRLLRNPRQGGMGVFFPETFLTWGPLLTAGIVAFAGLVQRHRRERLSWTRDKLVLLLGAQVTVLVVLWAISKLTPLHFISTTRVFFYGAPVAFLCALTAIDYSPSSRQFKYALSAVFIVFLVISLAAYPVYFVDGSEPRPTDEHRYTLVYTEQEHQALQFGLNTDDVVTTSKEELYYRSYADSPTVHEKDLKPFANVYTDAPNDALLIRRPNLKNIIHARGLYDYNYRIPGDRYDAFEHRTELDKVYSSGNVQWYSLP